MRINMYITTNMYLYKVIYTNVYRYINAYIFIYKVCSARKQDCFVKFMCGDATVIEWYDADLVFIHPTCFDDILLKKMIENAEKMVPGSFIVTITKMINSDYFELMEAMSGEMSWGNSLIYIYKRNEMKLACADRLSDRDFLISEGIILPNT